MLIDKERERCEGVVKGDVSEVETCMEICIILAEKWRCTVCGKEEGVGKLRQRSNRLYVSFILKVKL